MKPIRRSQIYGSVGVVRHPGVLGDLGSVVSTVSPQGPFDLLNGVLPKGHPRQVILIYVSYEK